MHFAKGAPSIHPYPRQTSGLQTGSLHLRQPFVQPPATHSRFTPLFSLLPLLHDRIFSSFCGWFVPLDVGFLMLCLLSFPFLSFPFLRLLCCALLCLPVPHGKQTQVGSCLDISIFFFFVGCVAQGISFVQFCFSFPAAAWTPLLFHLVLRGCSPLLRDFAHMAAAPLYIVSIDPPVFGVGMAVVQS
jgi:hypothetical protein